MLNAILPAGCAINEGRSRSCSPAGSGWPCATGRHRSQRHPGGAKSQTGACSSWVVAISLNLEYQRSFQTQYRYLRDSTLTRLGDGYYTILVLSPVLVV